MMRMRLLVTTAVPMSCLVLWAAPPAAQEPRAPARQVPALFDTAGACIACHTDLVTSSGEDVSFGPHWRASMMANAARDPYWQAAVRREVMEHPHARGLIEDECSACHMPMARYQSRAEGHEGEVFAHLPVALDASGAARLAADGVSCTLCHQIGPETLGERASFTAGFHVDTTTMAGERRLFGPFDVDRGRMRIMRSASGFVPARAAHLQQAAFCASCHTLITQAFDPNGKVVGELPEQVPYLEWEHSAYRESRSCQSCHMPDVHESLPITAVLGEPRAGLSRHAFAGGNFFMVGMLNRNRAALGVDASPQELDAAQSRAVEHLQTAAAVLSLTRAIVKDRRLDVELSVENHAGHKVPTAYPSRRAWVHFVVRDRHDKVVFESGAFEPGGRIAGNDNDTDGATYEPHHVEVTQPDQVQIYEAVLVDHAGAVTTGLLSAVRYVKDNRLLPRGFDKATAGADIAVRGDAAADADFAAGGDRVRYAVSVAGTEGPYRVEAELWYQPISYRWARSLGVRETVESRRFLSYYDDMAASSAVVLARTSTSGLGQATGLQ